MQVLPIVLSIQSYIVSVLHFHRLLQNDNRWCLVTLRAEITFQTK